MVETRKKAALTWEGASLCVLAVGFTVGAATIDCCSRGGSILQAQELESVLGTVFALLAAEGHSQAAEIVRKFPARAEQTGSDNWNGGTDIWEVFFSLPATDYAQLGQGREQVEQRITDALKTVLKADQRVWLSAAIVTARELGQDWRAAHSNLPREVRNSIVDGLRLEGSNWQGQLDDVEFLSRLYDLRELPSRDARFKDAAGDIWQHTVNNDDWDAFWVFSDSRFGLMDGGAETFLRFLCETVHPVVRPDREVVSKLVEHFNDQLRPSGWEIFEEERIGGRPRFAYRALIHHSARTVSRARTVADALDAGWMARAIQRLERNIDDDPELAIGTAKDLVESCCKTILGKRDVEYTRSADLNDLTKLVCKELQLVPEGVTDEHKGADNIRLILRNLTQLTNNLAQLRGLYGMGHGRDGKHVGLQPRHARLAVGAAVAFIDFVADTYRERETAKR